MERPLLERLYDRCSYWKRCKNVRYEAADALKAELGRADAYYNALKEIREVLGLNEHDYHELVIDEIKRLLPGCKWCGRKLSAGKTECARCAHDQSFVSPRSKTEPCPHGKSPTVACEICVPPTPGSIQNYWVQPR